MAGVIFVCAILVIIGVVASILLGTWWPLLLIFIIGLIIAFLPKG